MKNIIETVEQVKVAEGNCNERNGIVSIKYNHNIRKTNENLPLEFLNDFCHENNFILVEKDDYVYEFELYKLNKFYTCNECEGKVIYNDKMFYYYCPRCN